MIDLLLLYFFVRSQGASAQARGQSPSQARGIALVAWLVGEIGGAIIGSLAMGGQVGALIGGLVGVMIAVAVTLLVVDRLPVHHDNDPSRLTSQGDQLVGSVCVACEKPLMTTLEAGRCKTCKAPCHPSCKSAHKKHAHRNAPPPRAKSEAAVARDGASAT